MSDHTIWVLEVNVGKGWLYMPWPAMKDITGLLGIFLIASKERAEVLKLKPKAKSILEDFYKYPIRVRAAKYERVWPVHSSTERPIVKSSPEEC
jgi:hypothetical protein